MRNIDLDNEVASINTVKKQVKFPNGKIVEVTQEELNILQKAIEFSLPVTLTVPSDISFVNLINGTLRQRRELTRQSSFKRMEINNG